MPPSLTELLSETVWIRALARRLVRDPDAADDLAQEACVLALDRPPGHEQNLRAWLHRVLQNLLRQARRAGRRRQRREELAAAMRETHGADTVDLVERAATQRAVVDAVLELEQPFRDTVLLRYFEDLPPRAIAARMSVPIATVNSRLQRAAARLRQRLDQAPDTQGDWRLALLPLSLPSPTLLPKLGLLLMNTKLLTLAAAAVVVGGTALWLQSGTAGPAQAVERADVAATTHSTTEQRADTGTGNVSNERQVAVPASAPAAPAPAEKLRRIAGRVVDVEGRALAAVNVRWQDTRCATDATGAFACDSAEFAAGIVRTDDPGHFTVMCGNVRAGDAPPSTLVVAATELRLAGDVHTANGDVVANATVQVKWPDDLRSRLADISDTSAETAVRQQSRSNGTFELVAGTVQGAELVVTANGFAPDRRPLPTASTDTLHIVLDRPQPHAGTLQGMVVDPAGRPVAAAPVGLGESQTRSDALGMFQLDDDGRSETLTATAVGHRRGVVPRPAAGFSPFVVIALGAEPMQIHGTVVDQDGHAVAGALVWAADLTVLSDGRDLLTTEGIAAGCTTMGELKARFERGEFEGRTPQEVIEANPTAAWPRTRTGADGAFVMNGLEDRPYRLRALDRETLQMVEQDGVVAGTRGVRLELDLSTLLNEVKGVVVANDGSPVPGVEIAVQIDAQSTGHTTMHEQALQQTISDAQGRFTLRRVPREHAYLRLDGDGILPAEPARGLAGGLLALGGGSGDDLRLQVSLRLHVQIELLDPTSADNFTVCDANGENVGLTVFEGHGRRDTDRMQFAGGRSPVFVVPESATTLVLRKGDQEVRREALQLRPGAVNTLRL